MSISTSETELCKIFYKNGADKCPLILHSYSPEYHRILEEIRFQTKNVLEIGIGTKNVMSHIVGNHYVPGASLRSWKEYFTNAQIFGLDIDKSVLFEDDRIKCFYADQSSAQSLDEAITKIHEFTKEKDINFDIILDDGSHIKEHMILSYLSLNKYLKTGGIYIIEDIKRKDLQDFISLSVNGIKIDYIHRGLNEWDDFICYRKL